MNIYKKAYGKMMSKYKERVASAKTAGDFVAIWLIMFSLIIACGIIHAIVEWFSDLLWFLWFSIPRIADGWEYWFFPSFFFLFALFGVLHFILSFKEADVRFWDPRVHWLKGYCGKIDIEKIRKIHTDSSGVKTAEYLVDMLLTYITLVIALIVIDLFFFIW